MESTGLVDISSMGLHVEGSQESLVDCQPPATRIEPVDLLPMSVTKGAMVFQAFPVIDRDRVLRMRNVVEQFCSGVSFCLSKEADPVSGRAVDFSE